MVGVNLVPSSNTKAVLPSLAGYGNRLSARERMLQWGYKGDQNCVFCRNNVESRDHFFLVLFI